MVEKQFEKNEQGRIPEKRRLHAIRLKVSSDDSVRVKKNYHTKKNLRNKFRLSKTTIRNIAPSLTKQYHYF